MPLFPLPDLMTFEEFSGDWDSYRDAIYQVFCNEVVDKLSFRGQKIVCKYLQPIGGMHRSFWHLITNNPEDSRDDEDRIIDPRRCERIRWIAHLISQVDDPSIQCWETKRKSNTNVVIWLPSEKYMIILSKRSGYYLLTTAYTHGENKGKDNLRDSQLHKDPRK